MNIIKNMKTSNYIALCTIIITNLTFHDLVMKILQNLYISHINIVHWKHIWHMDL
jgi:hypothetical protein